MKSHSKYRLQSNSPFLTSVINSFKTAGMQESTQQNYIRWIREFLAFFGNTRHPKDITDAEVSQFITHIAVDMKLSYSSQNQALCALVHMYKYVINRPLGKLQHLLWARKPKKLPVVYNKEEIRSFLSFLQGDINLMVKLALCAGLRISECCQLTIACFDFERGVIRINSGKGNKDRETYLPSILEQELQKAIEEAKARFAQDEARQLGQSAPLYRAKYISDQWVFTPDLYRYSKSQNAYGRFPYSRQYIQKQFSKALVSAGIGGKGSFHALRHTFASVSLHHGVNIRELQMLLGHERINTTQIYTHLLTDISTIQSPLDSL